MSSRNATRFLQRHGLLPTTPAANPRLAFEQQPLFHRPVADHQVRPAVTVSQPEDQGRTTAWPPTAREQL